MHIHIRYKDIGPTMIILYPLLDIMYNTFSDKIHYSTFSIAYFATFIIITLMYENYLLSKKMLCLGFISFIYGLIFYSKSGSVLIQFFIFIILLNIFANEHYLSTLDEYITRHKKMIGFVIALYISFLMYSVIFSNGIEIGWNTFVLYGPYSVPHILAYEMLIILMLCLLNYNHSSKKIWVVLAIFFEMMIILTCARSAVLSSAIILMTFISWFKLEKKFYFIILGTLLLMVFFYYGAFDQIIEKTSFAIKNGSITNGREWIANSVFETFEKSSIFEKIFGSGYFNLIESNSRNLGTAIQGHNDFLTVLISFGLIGDIIYIWGFISYIRGKNSILCFACLMILAFYNGLFMYMPMVIGLGITKNYFAVSSNSVFNLKSHITHREVRSSEQL